MSATTDDHSEPVAAPVERTVRPWRPERKRMKTEVKLTEAVGKTLAAVEFSESYCGGQCVLAFTDGTFATLGVDRGYESGDEEIIEEPLTLFDFGDEAGARRDRDGR